MTNDSIVLYHAPNTRSSGTRTLLEELAAPYELHVLNMKAGEQRRPAYLAINPMGKVPAIRHGEALITEQVAIFLYLADLFQEKGLAPASGDPLRGPYLRWMIYYAACFEPGVTDFAMKREPAPPSMSPYGDYDSMIRTLYDQLERAPCLLGERFSAADILWGGALRWMIQFDLVPDNAALTAYVERAAARPAAAKVREADAALAAAQGD